MGGRYIAAECVMSWRAMILILAIGNVILREAASCQHIWGLLGDPAAEFVEEFDLRRMLCFC